jgi:MoaA/NifB/PqqE/SkfB family radical SAM enzyme
MLRRLVRTAQVAVQQRTHRLTTLPIVILYLNDICNSRCLTCAIWQNNERLKRPELRQMSDELLEALYEQMTLWSPAEVLLSGGEPTMHPRFADVVGRLRAMAIRVQVVTNGLSLPGFRAAELQGISEFFISFDAPDTESYTTIRGVDGFTRMGNGVRFVRSILPSVPITARCTLQRDNVGRLPELVGAARSLGFGRISFLAVDTRTDAFGRNHPDHAVVAERITPRALDLEAMAAGIRTLERSGAATFVESGTARLRSIHRYFLAVLGRAEFPPVACNAPWVSAVIETSGNLRGCFFHEVIGDFRDPNARSAVEFRSALRVQDNPTCRQCVCSKNLGPRGVWSLGS